MYICIQLWEDTRETTKPQGAKTLALVDAREESPTGCSSSSSPAGRRLPGVTCQCTDHCFPFPSGSSATHVLVQRMGENSGG